jgi:hypothetical protein
MEAELSRNTMDMAQADRKPFFALNVNAFIMFHNIVNRINTSNYFFLKIWQNIGKYRHKKQILGKSN